MIREVSNVSDASHVSDTQQTSFVTSKDTKDNIITRIVMQEMKLKKVLMIYYQNIIHLL